MLLLNFSTMENASSTQMSYTSMWIILTAIIASLPSRLNSGRSAFSRSRTIIITTIITLTSCLITDIITLHIPSTQSLGSFSQGTLAPTFARSSSSSRPRRRWKLSLRRWSQLRWSPMTMLPLRCGRLQQRAARFGSKRGAQRVKERCLRRKWKRDSNWWMQEHHHRCTSFGECEAGVLISRCRIRRSSGISLRAS